MQNSSRAIWLNFSGKVFVSSPLPNNSIVFESEAFRVFNLWVPYILILLAIAVLFCNAVVLSAFIKHHNLRTPFNTYLINLILADIAQSLFDLPFMVVSLFYAPWPLGQIGCNFSLYAKYAFSAAVRNTHSLISLNRLWAICLPISYKNYHTKVKSRILFFCCFSK